MIQITFESTKSFSEIFSIFSGFEECNSSLTESRELSFSTLKKSEDLL